MRLLGKYNMIRLFELNINWLSDEKLSILRVCKTLPTYNIRKKTGLLVNIDYYYVCIVLYALYADTVRYVLYIDNKVLLLFILVFYFCTKQMKTQ